MYIIKQTTMPNGASSQVHRLTRAEISEDAQGSTTSVTITINSFATTDSRLVVWTSSYQMPVDVLSQGIYPLCVANWLTGAQGPLQGGQILDDPLPLEILRSQLKDQIATLRDSYVLSGCDTPKGFVDTDEVSVRNLLGVYQAATVSLVAQKAFEVSWRLHDNSNVTLDAMGVIAMGNAVLQHVQACYQNSWDLKAALANAVTEADLTALDVTVGWPQRAPAVQASEPLTPNPTTPSTDAPSSTDTTAPTSSDGAEPASTSPSG